MVKLFRNARAQEKEVLCTDIRQIALNELPYTMKSVTVLMVQLFNLLLG